MKKFIKSKKMWFAFITVFISGVLIGVVAGVGGTLFVGYKCLHGPGMGGGRLLSHMTRQLDLTPEQKLEVEKIMKRMSEQLNETRNEQYPKIKNIISSSFKDIENLLDEKQKLKFTEIRERVKKFHHSRHGHKKRENPDKEKKYRAFSPHEEEDEGIQYPYQDENGELQYLLETLMYLHGH